MTQFLKLLCGLLFAALITACGGGGGSPGTTQGGSTGGTGTATASVTVDLVTSAGAATTTIDSTTPVFARATLRDAAGAVVSGEVVTFSGDTALVRFLPSAGTALTGSNGVATIQVLPATSTSAGAGTLNVAATVATKAVTGSTSFQVPPGVSDAPTSRVANFVMLLDRSTLANGGTATAKLTVVAVDSANNVVSGAAVTVATDANTVFTPGSTVTNAQGQYTGQIAIGTDKSDRSVVVTATVNGIVQQTTFQITGSQLVMTSLPTIPTPGGAATFTARVLDSNSVPIAGKTVSFSGDIGSISGRDAVTDSNGTATLSFVAPGVAGSYVVRAAASGINGQLSVQVGSSASIPAAVIPAGAQPGLSVNPNVVAPNTAGSTTNQAQLRFLFLSASNSPIPNVRVRFEIASSGLGSFDSAVSTGSSMVYTSAAGIATAAFIPGSTGSPTDGVTVRACYSANDFAAGTCPSSVSVNLTIAAQALAVSIGNDNTLAAGAGGTYVKTFVVTVADAAGRAVANAPVDISLDITHYGKGDFEQDLTFPQNIAEANTYVPNATTAPVDFGARVSCINEDFNRNGFVDSGENVNGSVDSFNQPTLEPRRSDIILSYSSPDVTTTNSSGILLIQVEYSQRFATWLSYRIRASTNVAGSQGSAERAFVTSYIDADEPNGSFKLAPYGVAACNSAN